jgi:hypothetical protein
MFRGDHPDLDETVGRAIASARDLEHPRIGSEHLLLALTTGPDPVARILMECGATQPGIHSVVCSASPSGTGAAADRDVLASLGIDASRFFDASGLAVLDRVVARQPRLPIGSSRSRWRCWQMSPPLGLDAQAALEASLRLAVARREREHRCEHLALTLITLDPGAIWTLTTAGVDSQVLFTRLALSFPPPLCNPLLGLERPLGRRPRHREIIGRYQHLTGRSTASAPTLGTVIVG